MDDGMNQGQDAPLSPLERVSGAIVQAVRQHLADQQKKATCAQVPLGRQNQALQTPPAPRLTVQGELDRQSTAQVNLHEAISVLENVLAPILAKPTDAGIEAGQPPNIGLIGRVIDHTHSIVVATRRVQSLVERLEL